MQRNVSINVHYPANGGRLGLRTDEDWTRELEPLSDRGDGRWTFVVSTDKPFVYYKPVLHRGGKATWSHGPNYLLLADSPFEQDVYPHFHEGERGTFSALVELPTYYSDKPHKVRVYMPPGYRENTLKRYPVLYMHDGNNLFLPKEASFGDTWEVSSVMDLLDSLRTLREVIVVGVWPVERMKEYTRPGYEDYGKFLVEELKPWVDATYRTLTDPQDTAVMGSSLGGVVSLFLGWQYPDAFGKVACMSSTFGYRDNLRDRVATEPKRNIKIYLDSGVPGDNYEVTKDMAELLVRRGYLPGNEMLYFAFPESLHSEKYWAMRSHLPYQAFFVEK